MRGPRQQSTALARAALSAILVLPAALGGCSTEACGGSHLVCGHFGVQECPPGCVAQTGCIFNPTQVDGPICSAASGESACLAIDLCGWDGTACRPRCELHADRAACSMEIFCVWTGCTGQPKPCGDYSPGQCPVERGCKLEPKLKLGRTRPAPAEPTQRGPAGAAWASCADSPLSMSLIVPGGSRPDMVSRVP